MFCIAARGVAGSLLDAGVRDINRGQGSASRGRGRCPLYTLINVTLQIALDASCANISQHAVARCARWPRVGAGQSRVRVHLKLPPYRALSRRRPGTYFSIKHLHKTFTAYGARMQCKSFIVRIGRILRILSATPTPAHYSMPGNTRLPAAACPRGPMPAWILSIFINLIRGKQQQQAQLVWQLQGYARLENALLSFRLKNFAVISIYFVFIWLRQKLKICNLHQIKKFEFYCILFGAVNAFFESH